MLIRGGDYFDPSNFAAPPDKPELRTYGTLGRNAFRSLGRTNFDFALAKQTPLTHERVSAEFRAEFFNILNHTQFYDPDLSITSGTFGRVTQTWDPRIIQLALRVRF